MTPWNEFHPTTQKQAYHVSYNNNVTDSTTGAQSQISYFKAWRGVIEKFNCGYEVGINLKVQIFNVKSYHIK